LNKDQQNRGPGKVGINILREYGSNNTKTNSAYDLLAIDDNELVEAELAKNNQPAIKENLTRDKVNIFLCIDDLSAALSVDADQVHSSPEAPVYTLLAYMISTYHPPSKLINIDSILAKRMAFKFLLLSFHQVVCQATNSRQLHPLYYLAGIFAHRQNSSH
jgi:hypothetical protein